MQIRKSNWQACKNILCIRLDNMGDLIMSGSAIRALKQSFNANITVLTSAMAAPVACCIEEIDDVIIYDSPWVKSNAENTGSFNQLVSTIKGRNFDAAVIFTVYSQNPLPTVMIAYIAGIPLRLAYCRENPYQLLTDWLPDKEPYDFIRHQVKRDLDLVASIGASTDNDKLHLKAAEALWAGVRAKLSTSGFDPKNNWLILHAGVSEVKRAYPIDRWIEAGKKIIVELGYQLVLTGSESEKELTDHLQQQIGEGSFSAGGLFNVDELITLINKSSLLLSVNTGTVHIAAAVGTPVVVLYALTNPQHTPWKVPCRVLPFTVDKKLHSKNQVIDYVNRLYYREQIDLPGAADIVEAVNDLLAMPEKFTDQELILIDRIKEFSHLP